MKCNNIVDCGSVNHNRDSPNSDEPHPARELVRVKANLPELVKRILDYYWRALAYYHQVWRRINIKVFRGLAQQLRLEFWHLLFPPLSEAVLFLK